jgi:hypothetical protein
MNTQKYPARLAQLRISAELMEELKDRASKQGITLAEAHRQVIARGLGRGAIVIPVVGKVDPNTNIIKLYDHSKSLAENIPEAA